MQAEMLDSVVSSNSQSLFDFNAIHNGEACIESLDPKDTRENRFWFTIAMFCTIYGVAEQTIRDNLKSLGDDGEIGLPEISGRRINIKDSWVYPAKDECKCLEHSDTSAMCKLCREKDKVVVRANDLTSDDLSDVKNREYTLISQN